MIRVLGRASLPSSLLLRSTHASRSWASVAVSTRIWLGGARRIDTSRSLSKPHLGWVGRRRAMHGVAQTGAGRCKFCVMRAVGRPITE